MKKGCLILLLIWIVLSALYYQVLQGTELADQIWVPILYGLSGVLVIANLQGLRMVFGMRSAAKRAPHEWKAGSLVGFSGRIQAVSKALIAPFSGKEAVIIEYEIERRVGSGKSTSMQNHFMGFLMTPCTVYSARGPVRLIGFPLLAQIHPASDDPYSYEKAARYLAAAKFKELQK
ncbi:MAG: hypothetical protein DCC75_00225, partial [Proteobacteria bacterium]